MPWSALANRSQKSVKDGWQPGEAYAIWSCVCKSLTQGQGHPRTKVPRAGGQGRLEDSSLSVPAPHLVPSFSMVSLENHRRGMKEAHETQH